jgi:hypothetical protein
MRIAVTTVMYEDDWHADAANLNARLALLDGILETTTGVDLLVLPAGFVCATSEAAAKKAAARVVAKTRSRVAVVFGCDVTTSKKKARKSKAQNFAYLARRDGSPALWHVQQLAATSADRIVVNDADDDDRVVSFLGKKVGFLICGEMMAKRRGRGFGGQRLGKTLVQDADLVIDIAHADVKTGNWKRTWSAALRDLGGFKSRRPVAMAQHLYSESVRNVVKSYADKDGPKRLVYALMPSKPRTKVSDHSDTDRVGGYVDFYDV